MRKIVEIILITLLCICLAGCGKSKAAVKADNLILEIGEVTLYSGKKISEAEKAVESLKEDEYDQLENLQSLQQARKDYDKLVEEKEIRVTKLKIQALENSINKIGTVSLKKESLVKTARKNYNNADDEVKSQINNLPVLEAAEEELSKLKVQNAIELIKQIGTVTLESGEAVQNANTAYSQLSLQEKESVENYETLTAAINKLADLEAKERDRKIKEQEEIKNKAVSAMRTETDRVLGITWYYHKNFPNNASARSFLLPYIGKQGEEAWLMMRCNFTASNWLFFESIIVSIDGKNYTKSFDYFDIKRDNAAWSVWEWTDYEMGKADIDMLKEIMESEETIIRFQGENSDYDLTVKQSDKDAIRDTFIVFDTLKNS